MLFTDLFQEPLWIIWKYDLSRISRNGKPAKVPRSPKSGKNWTNDNQNVTAAEAKEAVERYGADGIGIRFVPKIVPIIGIDFDNCIQDEKIHPAVRKLLNSWMSYAEVSPSEKGVKVWLQGSLPPGWKKHQKKNWLDGIDLEVYDSGRYFTVTRKVIPITGCNGDIKNAGEVDFFSFLESAFQSTLETEEEEVTPDFLEDVLKLSVEESEFWLSKIDPIGIGYDMWIKVGMSLSEYGEQGFQLWHNWSKLDLESYVDEDDLRDHWKSFAPGDGITSRSLIHWAKEQNPDEELVYVAQNLVWTPTDLSNVLSRPKKSWIVENWFGRRDVGFLAGDSGSGKTAIIMDLIMSILSGQDKFAGEFKIQEKDLVIGYTTSEGYYNLGNRFQSAMDNYGMTPEDLQGRLYIWDENVPRFNLKMKGSSIPMSSVYQFWRDVQELAIKLDILFVDTLSLAALGSDLSDNAEMTEVMSISRLLSNSGDMAIFFSHHNNRQRQYRGAAAMRDNADFFFTAIYDRKKDVRYISCKDNPWGKLKDGPEWDSIQYELMGDESPQLSWLGYVDPDELQKANKITIKLQLEDEIWNHPDGVSIAELAQILGKTTKGLERPIKQLLDEGKITKQPGRGPIPATYYPPRDVGIPG